MVEVETPSAPDDQPETSSSDAQEEAPVGAPSTPAGEAPPADSQADSPVGQAPVEEIAGEPPVDDTAIPTESEVSSVEQVPAAEGTPPVEETPPMPEVSEIVPPPSVARDIALIQSTVDLLEFVRFGDFVPCDYNRDGIVDILALNSRLSTGYGFTGIGNGLFTAGPSFDLPFRPAASVPLGDSSAAINGLLLVSAAGTVSVFYPLTEDDPSMTAKASAFSVFRVGTVDGPVFVIHGEDETSVRIYLLVNGGLQDKGEYPASRTSDIIDWYNEITTWHSPDEEESFPLPPTGMEKTARIADLNGDAIPDLLYCHSGEIVYLLSQDGEALMEEKTVACHTSPTVLRIADVDGNGFPDVLALIGSSGTMEVYLVEPQ